MGLLTWLMLHKIWTMEDKIDQLQKQLHPSETPETRDDIDEWLAGEDTEVEDADSPHLIRTPETEEEIEEWLNGSNDLE